MALGKVSGEFLATQVYPYLGAERDDVLLGPKHGVDFGLLDVSGQALVLATDPVSVLPRLGFARAGEFAIDIILADVAVSGVAPSHLSISFALPTDLTEQDFTTLWRAIHQKCRQLGVNVVTGHTARYPGATFPWVGAATALGVGAHEDVVRPDGARPGDKLLVTNGPGVEVTGLLATLFPEADAFASVDERTLDTMQACLSYTGLVEEAQQAVKAGRINAMHDATEGGLKGAFVEMANAAGVRFDVHSESVPVLPGVEAFSDIFDVDPWACTTSGTLILSVRPADAEAVASALRETGGPAAIVGEVTQGEGTYIDGTPIAHPETDPSWDLYDRLNRDHTHKSASEPN